MKGHTCTNQSGSTLIDFVVGALLAVVLALTAVDMVLYMIGYGSNDSAARDSARAAGTADSASVALQAALMACASHQTDGFLVTQPLVDLREFHFADDATSPVPLVSVTTYCSLKLPMANFFDARLADAALSARRRYIFPALVLSQRLPDLELVDMPALITPGAVGLPLTNGAVPGIGSSDTGGATE